MSWPTSEDFAPLQLSELGSPELFIEVGGVVVPLPDTFTFTELSPFITGENLSLRRGYRSTRILRSDDGLGDPGAFVLTGQVGHFQDTPALALGYARRLAERMKGATALWRGGEYLPLRPPHIVRLPSQDLAGGLEVAASLAPKEVAFRTPILDDVSAADLATVRSTDEFERLIPVFAFTPASRYSVPVTFSKMPSGTIFVGVQIASPGVYGVASVGHPLAATGVPLQQSAVIGFNQDRYVFTAPAQGETAEVAESAIGFPGDLTLFCMSWHEGGLFTVYSLTDEGFRTLVSRPIGTVDAFATRRAYLGTGGSNQGVNGYLMPGAAAFGAPFFSHRPVGEAEARSALGAWRAHLQAFAVYNPDTPDPAIAFSSLPPSLALVVGVKQTVTVTVQRFNGAPGTMTLTAEFDNVAIRHSVRAVMDTDPDSDTFIVEAWAETGIPAGAYSLSLRASAGTLSISGSVPVRVSLTAPGLPANTTHFWKLYDPVGRSLAVMAQNSASGATSGHLVLGGTARYSSLWDAVIGDGANLAGYGPSIVTAENVVDLATSHTVSWAFYALDTLAVNSVLFTLASPTQKNQFYQVYKAATGLKLRTSSGTTTQVTAESGAALAVTGGEQTVSVTVDVNGVLTLLNPNVDGGSVSTPYVPMSGSARLTLFGAKLADGTVQGLSKGVALVGAVQSVLVT